MPCMHARQSGLCNQRSSSCKIAALLGMPEEFN